MLERLVIYHSTTGQLKNLAFDNHRWVNWSTCLRQMAIGFEEAVSRSLSETYLEADAYRFFLEVISGLHSPIIGETEVMGQFKDLLEKVSQSNLHHKFEFLDFFRSVLKDAKYVRTQVLKDMGSRSYGSLIRKYTKDCNHVTFIGAGKLVTKILPWLKETKDVTVKCRRPEQGQNLKSQFVINVEPIEGRTFGDALVIAAPMSAKTLRDLLKGVHGLKQIIDLRETSSQDPMGLEIPTITLAQLFGEIELKEKDSETKVAKARALIKDLALQWTLKAEYRPFGWEDLCG